MSSSPSVKPASAPASVPAAPGSGRIVSVDALRGFDMFWICGGGPLLTGVIALFVQPIPDEIKTQMSHVKWEGFTAWDLIMPLFLFIVGTAMPFSFAKRLAAGQSKLALYRKILIRFVILFVLGMIAQGNLLQADLSRLRLYSNTLQAIACGYLISSVIMIHLPIIAQVGMGIVLLVGYWLLMRLVPFGGHEAGTLEEKVNLALYIDEQLLGKFRDGTTYTWILSSLAFGATVLLGVFSGHLLRSGLSPWKKFGILVAMGVVSLGAAWGWSHESLNSWRCPIIKHLFTSSMVLWACGWSYLLLALFYLVIDVLGFRRWAYFFTIIGSNAIVAYMACHPSNIPGMIGNILIGGVARNLKTAETQWLHPWGELMGPLAAFAVLWFVLWYLHRKGTFVRI